MRRSKRLLSAAGFSLLLVAVAISGCGGISGSSPAGDLPPAGNDTHSSDPTIHIASPAAGSTTTTANMVITGTAGGNIVQVSWRNAATNLTGTASGTVNWSATVPLQSGSNTLTVTAQDSAGKTASASMAVTYIQSGQASLLGQVDSSLVDRSGNNAVYVYTGTVTPDDLGGAGARPYAVVPVLQDNGGCTWRYRFGALPAGQYTVAYTSQAANDDPTTNDAIVFTGTAGIIVPVGAAVVRNFSAARILKVGPGRAYSRLGAAASAAQNGDVIEIDAGEYADDIVVWRQDNLTLRGVGGTRAHMRATRLIPYTPGNDSENGMGIWVTKGRGITVENIEFSGAKVPDQNGAGIRVDGPDINICNSYFHDNENGILGGTGGNVLVEHSEFANNGIGEYGRTHNMYISSGTRRFTLRYSYSHHAHIGHNVKSRAQENHILYNRIMDEVTGSSSYDIDIPDAGLTYIIGNLIQQGAASDNSTIVAYGAEGAGNPIHELYVVNNTIVNDRGSGTFLSVRSGTTARIVNNIFSGNGTVLSGPGTLVSNLVSNTPGLASITGFDYRLTAASSARDAGTSPGSVNGFDLTPVHEYVHPAGQKQRARSGNIDIGAYEYSP